MIENIVMIVTLLISVFALYNSTKKQKHDVANTDASTEKTKAEENNYDADTIKTLYGLIHEQEQRYKSYKVEQEGCYAQLVRDFEAYKVAMNDQVADIVNENVKLRKWAKRLATQLEQAGIIPVTFEL